MPECSDAPIESKAPDGRTFTAAFDGGSISTDGGVVVLSAVEERCRILESFGECFTDHRDPARVLHTATQLATQRVLGVALGYEDLCDHDILRHDPLLTSAVGKRDRRGETLASSATLGRIENGAPGLGRDDRYRKITLDYEKVDHLLIDLFLEAHESPPEEIVVDLDATDAKIHGKQEGRFFHGYYDEYCCLPLYIFVGDHVFGARLRRADAGSVEELDRIVDRIREGWLEATDRGSRRLGLLPGVAAPLVRGARR
ncbi:MAG: transposase [Planctomycetota bacterium]